MFHIVFISFIFLKDALSCTYLNTFCHLICHIMVWMTLKHTCQLMWWATRWWQSIDQYQCLGTSSGALITLTEHSTTLFFGLKKKKNEIIINWMSFKRDKYTKAVFFFFFFYIKALFMLQIIQSRPTLTYLFGFILKHPGSMIIPPLLDLWKLKQLFFLSFSSVTKKQGFKRIGLRIDSLYNTFIYKYII